MTDILNAQTIAEEFNRSYENAWNAGLDSVIELYAEDSILVGYTIANGQSSIANLLSQIIQQGWTQIKIKTMQTRFIGDFILVANEYTAIGSGGKTGEILNSRSSHVLSKKNNKWVTVMHTAM